MIGFIDPSFMYNSVVDLYSGKLVNVSGNNSYDYTFVTVSGVPCAFSNGDGGARIQYGRDLVITGPHCYIAGNVAISNSGKWQARINDRQYNVDSVYNDGEFGVQKVLLLTGVV